MGRRDGLFRPLLLVAETFEATVELISRYLSRIVLKSTPQWLSESYLCILEKLYGDNFQRFAALPKSVYVASVAIRCLKAFLPLGYSSNSFTW
jgi:hypothetical protein